MSDQGNETYDIRKQLTLLLNDYWEKRELASGQRDAGKLMLNLAHVDAILQLEECRFELLTIKQKIENNLATVSYNEYFENCKRVFSLEVQIESFIKKQMEELHCLLNYLEEKYCA